MWDMWTIAAWSIRGLFLLSLLMFQENWFPEDFYSRTPELNFLTNKWLETDLPPGLYILLRFIVSGVLVWAITEFMLKLSQ